MTIQAISERVIRVAKAEILPRYKNLGEADISAKSPGDMVSIADIAAEKALTNALKSLFPAAIIGGEEMIAQQPALLAEIKTADHAFLIDPVDGTNNFIKGDVRFALMLTELRKGEAVAAWIYLPVQEKMAMAERGSGAFLNGKRIKITPRPFQPGNMIAAAHINRFPEDLRNIARKNLHFFNKNSPAFCAGYDYISLLEGTKDFSLYYRTLPWDHLPGALIFSESGGYVGTLHGGDNYSIHHLDKGLLSAPCEEDWHSIREMIFPGSF